MSAYCHGGGQVLLGLVRRRAEELALFNSIDNITNNIKDIKVGTEVKLLDCAWRGVGSGRSPISKGEIDALNHRKLRVGKIQLNKGSHECEVYYEENGKIGGALWIPINHLVRSDKYVWKHDNSDTVQYGDTLGEIAVKLGVTVDYLVRKNGISNPNMIYVGQTIKY